MAQRKNVGNVRHLRSWGLGSLSVSLPFFQLVLPVSLSSIFRLSVSHLPDILLSHVLPVSLPPISKSPCVLSSCILKKHCCDESVKWHDMVTCNTSMNQWWPGPGLPTSLAASTPQSPPSTPPPPQETGLGTGHTVLPNNW